MNIKTKICRYGYEECLNFGWQKTDSYRGGRAKHHYTNYVLVRDKDMRNYPLVATLEKKYYFLKSQIKYYEPMDPLISICLFLFLILPFVIYAVCKNAQKRKIQEQNNKIEKQMAAIIKEARGLL